MRHCLLFPVLSLSFLSLAVGQETTTRRAVPAAPAPAPSSATQANGVAAQVNGKFITKNEVNDSVKAMSMLLLRRMMDPAQREAELASIRERALNDLIEREIVLSEYEKMGGRIRQQYIDEDVSRIIRENFEGDRAKFLRELARQGLSWTKFKELHEKRMIVGIMAQQATQGVGFPTPEQKETYFKKHESEFREDARIKLRTIAIPKLSADGTPAAQRKVAEEIRRRVASGNADFANEARSYSADSKAADGGDWGWVPKEGVLAAELANVAFGLSKGAVSQVFEFRGLYYILYIEDKELGKLRPQAEIDEALDKLVLGEMRKAAREEWINKLKKKATIKTY